MAIDTEFMKLAAHIRLAHEKLEHGLPCYIDKGEMRLRLPPHKCPNQDTKESTEGAYTRLWVPFRATDFIPQVGIEKLSTLSNPVLWGIPIQDAERLTESYAFSCWRNWKKNKPKR
ncbi:hypothetical protein ECZU41_51330 [Escherichia coli]|nr:hypothetical protein ECZU41_51330 [Escherichia coli]